MPTAQTSDESVVSAGFPPTIILGLPGVHVPAGAKEQGCGVSTPRAAAVAAATAGFASEEHIPKGPSCTSAIVPTTSELLSTVV